MRAPEAKQSKKESGIADFFKKNVCFNINEPYASFKLHCVQAGLFEGISYLLSSHLPLASAISAIKLANQFVSKHEILYHLMESQRFPVFP